MPRTSNVDRALRGKGCRTRAHTPPAHFHAYAPCSHMTATRLPLPRCGAFPHTRSLHTIHTLKHTLLPRIHTRPSPASPSHYFCLLLYISCTCTVCIFMYDNV